MTFVKNGFLWCIVVFFCQGFASIKILENTASKMSFEWTTDSVKYVEDVNGGVSIRFCDANIIIGENMEAMLPGYAFYVGVPQSGEQKVLFTALSSHTQELTKDVVLCKSVQPRYPNVRFEDTWLSNPTKALFGTLRTQQYVIRPFVYDKEDKKITVLDRALFTIEYPVQSVMSDANTVKKSDYTRMLSELVLNYSIASKWKESCFFAKRKTLGQQNVSIDNIGGFFKIGDGHSGFNEGTIEENGIVKITGKELLRVFGSRTDLSSIALYASYKGELPSITPAFSDIPKGISEISCMRFDNGVKGVLDSQDYMLAYVSGASDWVFDSTKRQFTYAINHYDDYRRYWIGLATGGLGKTVLQANPVTGDVTDTLSSAPAHYLLKISNNKSYENRDGGLEWNWKTFIDYPGSVENSFFLQNLDVAKPCSVKVTSYSWGQGSLNEFFVNSTKVCSQCGSSSWYPVANANQDNSLLLSINAKRGDSLELQHIEFKYYQTNDMTNKKMLTIFSPEQKGLVRYKLYGITNKLLYIFRIGNNDESIHLVDSVRKNNMYEWTDTAGIGIRYFIGNEDCFKAQQITEVIKNPPPPDFVLRSMNSMKNIGLPIDYLVMSHPDFLDQARELCKHKKNIGSFTNPMAVSVTDIYNQFSGGNTDPAAIRNCLLYIKEIQKQMWPQAASQLEYVVFMGAGNYDYRGIKLSNTSYIPVAELDGQCMEDFFVCLDSGSVAANSDAKCSMFLGRIPCRSNVEAQNVVDKIIQIENPAKGMQGNWHNRILLVADDDMQGLNHDRMSNAHTISSESIEEFILQNAPDVDVRKTYLLNYPWNGQLEKPTATQALINEINNGVSLVNYFGHGAPNIWADEHLFMPENMGNLKNDGMLPLVNSFSCSVGEFDQLGGTRCLSEYLVIAEKKGAIATIAATRTSTGPSNESLARNLYANLFAPRDSVNAGSIGFALTKAKNMTGDGNQKVYSLLGDPSIRYSRPRHTISFSQFFGRDSSNDTVKALQRITIRGSVSSTIPQKTTEPLFGAAGSLPAYVQIAMFNPWYVTKRKDNGKDTAISYREPGVPLFSGQTSVKNGVFEQQVLIPKNVSFDKIGAKIIAYAWQGADIAAGVKSNIVFHGYDQLTITDTSGPHISIRPIYNKTEVKASDPSVVQGTLSTDRIQARLPFTMEIQVSDSSGIDVVSTNPDEGLTYEVLGVKSLFRTNINQRFQFLQGDYRRGSATVSFDGESWTPGLYKLLVSSEDLLGNITHKTFDLEIVGEQDLGLYHVFNYPNPMRMGESSRFYFDLSTSTVQLAEQNVRVIIKIYTLSGRLLRVIPNARRGELFDGKDNFGNKFSPGVYLYQILASSQQKLVKSKIEKLAINPPR